MKIVALVALVATLTITTAATRPSTEGRSVSAVRSANPAVRSAKCIRAAPRLRARIVDRRLAAWRWQDEVAVPRTRSAARERTAIGCPYLRWIRGLWTGRADEAWRFYVSLREPEDAICHVFGIYCSEAIAVAECESGDRDGDLSGEALHATNGQYLGMFQMGDSEREAFGHGETALAQARAAYAYFVTSGRDWSPWSCKP